jgi:hypothetical protein
MTNAHNHARANGGAPPPGFSLRTPRGLLRIDRSFPSVAGAGFAATTWATTAGAIRAVDRCRLYLQGPPVGAAAAAALALLDNVLVLPHDEGAEIWHDGLRARVYRVDITRREMLQRLGGIVDAVGFVGPGALVDGVKVTAEDGIARIEREIMRIMEAGAADPEVAAGWLSEAGLRAWVTQRQERARR